MPVPTIPGRWLKNKRDGTIYGYSDLLARNPAVVEVSEQEAFPEKFIPEAQKGRVSRVSLNGPEVPVAPKAAPIEVAEEVARDIEKKSLPASDLDEEPVAAVPTDHKGKNKKKAAAK